jgi:hypothetical protein
VEVTLFAEDECEAARSVLDTVDSVFFADPLELARVEAGALNHAENFVLLCRQQSQRATRVATRLESFAQFQRAQN